MKMRRVKTQVALKSIFERFGIDILDFEFIHPDDPKHASFTVVFDGVCNGKLYKDLRFNIYFDTGRTVIQPDKYRYDDEHAYPGDKNPENETRMQWVVNIWKPILDGAQILIMDEALRNRGIFELKGRYFHEYFLRLKSRSKEWLIKNGYMPDPMKTFFEQTKMEQELIPWQHNLNSIKK